MVYEPQPTKGSRAKVDYHIRQLRKLFSRASDEQFLQLMWAIDALRSGKAQHAANYLAFPPGAIDQSMGSQFLIHEWETETLIIQLLLAIREEIKEGGISFDCSRFADVAKLVNRLRKLEDVESAVYLQDGELNVFAEIYRIAQRQFHWQRGYFNVSQFYRYAYLYAQGKCGEYFQRKFGIPVAEFNFVGFALFTQSQRTPWVKRNIALPEVGLTEEIVKQALPLLLISVNKAREETRQLVCEVSKKHGAPIPTAYLPSILRRFPFLSLKEDSDRFIAPIPECILIRVTSGLYHDLISDGPTLLADANDRFEQYVANYVSALMGRFKVRRAYLSKSKKGISIATPDILVDDADRLSLVIECKATKLNYLAQFAENPLEAGNRQYLQIVNGVLQLWRFFSHVRRGLLVENIDTDTAAMVVTLDSFLIANQALRAKLIDKANALADMEEGIIAHDRRAIIFCPVAELEIVLSHTDEDRFLASLKAACDQKYAGWDFATINRQESEGKSKIEKKFPFNLYDLLPWWKRISELKAKNGAAI